MVSIKKRSLKIFAHNAIYLFTQDSLKSASSFDGIHRCLTLSKFQPKSKIRMNVALVEFDSN